MDTLYIIFFHLFRWFWLFLCGFQVWTWTNVRTGC